jgi:hypothetical protein
MQAEIKLELGKDYFKLEEIRCRFKKVHFNLHNIIFNFEFSGSLIHYMRNKKKSYIHYRINTIKSSEYSQSIQSIGNTVLQ